ncbi:Histone lysine acetyltransferase CREBBP [Taenia solium]|eukprot:TsM_000347200 transcript=TsM_000347200 gene=TsM_000347200
MHSGRRSGVDGNTTVGSALDSYYALNGVFYRSNLPQRTNPHYSTLCDVHQHIVKCTARVNCKMPQCAPSRQLLLHYYNCGDQQCTVCKPMKYEFGKRVHPVETATNAISPSVNDIRAVLTADYPDLTDTRNSLTEQATRHVKRCESYTYNKANVVGEYKKLSKN